ncbi:MAG: hypothetical protein M1814_002685 [Vezdaea aestivalis]|nr:MAG: hypothetical protein M1814_002685 [Vezdaea aestivalis]
MARTSTLPISTSTSPSSPTQTSLNLTRLLTRLESLLLSSKSPLQRPNSYDRTRIGANLEYARTLLAQLEASSPKSVPAGRNAKEIAAKRALIKRLNERLFELGHLDDPLDDSDLDVDSDGEDILAGIDDDEPASLPTAPAASKPASISTSTLRSRHPGPTSLTSSAPTAQTSSSQPSTSSTLLLSQPSQSTSTLPSTEKRLDRHASEQEALTTSLYEMAQRLKENSRAFQSSLDGETGLLDRVGGALDRNADGMKVAEGRMGRLRKMTEGLGFFKRIGMLVWIAGMWVALVVLMGLPKFR